MKPILLLSLCFLFTCSSPDLPINESAEKETLTELLNDFLDGASVNDYAIHDRFWADDLIYTSSSGERFPKETILSGIRNAEPTDEPGLVYHAEETQINVFNSTAIVAFKLVAVNPDESRMEFFNTGTFLKRDGLWKAVAWQATRIPVTEE